MLARRGYNPEKVELVRSWLNGEFEPKQMLRIFMRIGGAYQHDSGLRPLVRGLIAGAWRSKMRAEPMIFAGRCLKSG